MGPLLASSEDWTKSRDPGKWSGRRGALFTSGRDEVLFCNFFVDYWMHLQIASKRASINDGHEMLVLFCPPPPLDELICGMKFTQPHSISLLFNDPSPPSDADIISGDP